ncbi:peptidoglycan-binding domain-containing protein [Pseudanabaena sp. ABRG5-3]|uniref:peptidoglycan-binding domain-containing protein n=1 Tax=Pseudanabaena sp. ABRG5-3 TaxID=685565 RepID=UPI000DC73E1B|nr:peptidoglycan-binding protein [Pseudanabaena sp. ABRG5-3]BBC26082.1 peptidoglycan-binding protein [Pseudanabaena sp. ABRG5-3]
MELLAYIQEEFIRDDQAITTESNTPNVNIETTFQTWLKKLTTKSAKLSLNVILAGTTILIGLGSTLNALAEVTPSSDVKYVQSLLAKNGFDPGAIDGVAGASTKNAIIRAQQSLGLTADGVAGSRTIAALESGAPVASTSSKADDSTTTSAITPSASVMNLQKLLADRGFYNGAVDGIMGNQTRSAIVAAQKAYNLTPDGVAGPQTLAALESDSKAVVTPISATTSAPTTKSTEVANLQDLLSKRGFYNGAVDGIMGAQTRAAIIAAQKNYGLAADGIAGAQTLAALESGSRKVNIAAQNSDATKDTVAKSSDSGVLAVQQLLAKRGFYNGAIDGVKGPQTRAAIIAAQNAYGLTPDGVAGVQTVAALEKDAKTTTSVSTKPTNQATTTSTKTNSSVADENVANLQNLLTDRGFYNGPITGFLGPRTKAAIVAAQQAYGLTTDGVAGSQTIAALESGAPRQQIAVTNNTPTVKVVPQPQVTTTPQPPAQPQLQPKIQVQPQVQLQAPQVQLPQVQPQAKVTPQATPQPQETAKPQVQPTPATPIATATPAPTTQASASNAQVLELQKLLSKRGFYNGKADGVLTAETRNAIVRAQNFYTITPADGAPSNKLIDSLSKDTFISEGN